MTRSLQYSDTRPGRDEGVEFIGYAAPFRTTGFEVGASLVGSLDDIEGVLARVDGEAHR